MLDELERLGLNLINQKSKEAATGIFSGKTFLFTGTLSQFKRSNAEALVEEKGGKIVSGVSSKLDYLVVGEDAGSKLEKAKKIGTIGILSENEFKIMLEN
jgi:DNA ligase (NAD+)